MGHLKTSFLSAVLDRYPDWRQWPIVERSGSGWASRALIVDVPSASDIEGEFDLDEVADEITISFDYGHIHLLWPPKRVGEIWSDALALVDAILTEKVVASSGWIDGQLRVASLHEANREPKLLVRNLELIRTRSWRGTFNHDLQID